MRLFLFYAFCSVKNQLRRLFKTWVAIFLLVCVAFGVLIGLGAAFLEDMATGGELPDEPAFEEDLPEEPWTEEDTAGVMAFTEVAIGGVILLLLAFQVMAADKNGGAVFLQADVNLLFPSPMKPQSVLLFRLMTQIGATLLVGVYMLFQLPNLALNLGVSPLAGLLCILALCLLIVLGTLIRILLYTLGAAHPRVRRLTRPVLYASLLLLAGSFYLYWQRSGMEPLAAVGAFFNAPFTRLIPLYGWLKGLCMYALEGHYAASLLCLGGLCLLVAVLVLVIWRLRADFYEDALAKSAETAELQQSVAEGRTIVATRKKDRSERLWRDGLRHGRGASVYFFKTMYNRFRFAHFHVLTKTAETYLVAAIGVSLLCRLALGADGLLPVMLTLGGLVFFRSLGNPLATDTQMDSFYMVPENAHAKVLFSMLGGTVSCLLDLLPAALVAALLLPADPLIVLLWLLFILTVDFYSTNVGSFIDLSLPAALAPQIKQIIQIMFVYFGLLPDIALLAIGGVLGLLPLFAAVAAGVNLLIGFAVFAFVPLFIAAGRK